MTPSRPDQLDQITLNRDASNAEGARLLELVLDEFRGKFGRDPVGNEIHTFMDDSKVLWARSSAALGRPCEGLVKECGNGALDPGEECDGSNDNACRRNCIAPGHIDECKCRFGLPPNPVFILPAGGTTVVSLGMEVLISFDARDPENDVQWRVFYLSATDSRNEPADQLGTQLATGSGNAGIATLSTTNLYRGDYTLGMSATDSGYSIAITVARGDGDLIITNNNGPVIRVVDTGACCVSGACNATNYESQCNASGGQWFKGQSCPGFSCP